MEVERIAVSQSHEKEIEEWKDRVDHMEARWAVVSEANSGEDWKCKAERLESKCMEMEKELERRGKAVIEKEGARSKAENELREVLLKLSDVESNHAVQRSRLQSDYDRMTRFADEWKEKYDHMERQYRDQLLDENDKCQRSIVTEFTNTSNGSSSSCVYNSSSSTSSSSSAINDELVDQIGVMADENCRLSSRCCELENELQNASCRAEILDGLVQRIEVLESENHRLTCRCTELEQELKCASTQALSLGELIEKIDELGEENGRLSSKCRELECELQCASVAATQCVQDVTRDLESSKRNEAEAHVTIKTLQMETHDFRTKAKELVRGLRHCSSLLTSRLTSHERSVQLVDENEDEVVPIWSTEAAQAEDDAFHESMEYAICLTNEISKKMTTVIENYETSVNEYDAKFAALNETLNREIYSNDELSRQLDALLKDNRTLIKELQESNALVVTSVRTEIQQEQLSKETWNKEKKDLVTSIDGLKRENERLQESLSSLSASLRNEHEHKLKKEKETAARLRDIIDGASKERDEAYEACKVLQDEINLLRKLLEKSKERVGELQHSDGSVPSNSDREKLVELLRANETLTKELKQKNATLQAVQGVFGGLKEDQTNIRKTIEMLRVENAKLRGTQPPPPPSSKPKSSSSSLNASDSTRMHNLSPSSIESSDSSQSSMLEVRIRNIEKENTGLREANATLSTKLFDEMERTDALRVANEGLATRICKLVAFIQQNVDNGGKGVGPMVPSTPFRRGKNSSK
ncbi:hypothetical protein ACHAXA_007458 [Cyclostephanos tholiformis]|uniref:Uncharacterized protein n=1 Tax=Cyclostephanos tholiformis TaxID=382380 RepID=A0ABD3R8M6_9STRA